MKVIIRMSTGPAHENLYPEPNAVLLRMRTDSHAPELAIPYRILCKFNMGVLKKVIILSCLVLLAALVWQWTRSIDIQGKKNYGPL